VWSLYFALGESVAERLGRDGRPVSLSYECKPRASKQLLLGERNVRSEQPASSDRWGPGRSFESVRLASAVALIEKDSFPLVIFGRAPRSTKARRVFVKY